MAEQAAGAVASALIGGVTDRALCTVIRKLRSRSRPAATDEKLQRLETLVLKLRCAVEVSEKHAVTSASLLEWRDRLRVAAAEGEAVVLDFQLRAREEEDQGRAAATSAPGQQQDQPAGAGASPSKLYFTRSALSGMAQRVRDATRRLFSTDEDMQKLDSALEKMERLSPDITQFLMALQLEVSPALDQQAAKRSAPALIPAERRVKMKESSDTPPSAIMLAVKRSRMHPEQRPRKAVTASEITQLASADEAEDTDREAKMLAMKLNWRLECMVSYIKKTDGRDMAGLEWFAEWAALLREAVDRGNAVLQTLRSGSDAIHKQGSGGALEEDGELYSFARAVERLVLDHEVYWLTYAQLIKQL